MCKGMPILKAIPNLRTQVAQLRHNRVFVQSGAAAPDSGILGTQIGHDFMVREGTRDHQSESTLRLE